MRIAFEYDPRKAAANFEKHGITFAEAMTVFEDPLAETFPDELHSADETRCITLGLSSRQRLLFVSHLEEDNRIRLIGARLADNAEREAYEELQRRR
ncbi:MAG: BrnT family toxin [Acidobacteriota bacterium]